MWLEQIEGSSLKLKGWWLDDDQVTIYSNYIIMDL